MRCRSAGVSPTDWAGSGLAAGTRPTQTTRSAPTTAYTTRFIADRSSATVGRSPAEHVARLHHLRRGEHCRRAGIPEPDNQARNLSVRADREMIERVQPPEIAADDGRRLHE